MKLLKIMPLLVLALSFSAHADYGSFTCKSGSQKIKLALDETSDISLDTAHLTINNKDNAISNINVNETQYGILGIKIRVGQGPGQYRYEFNNLGSDKCLGVYGSKQTGAATVSVFNAIGKIALIECKCEQD